VPAHFLDNPIWEALTTNNKGLSTGDDFVKFMEPEVGLFAGMQTIDAENLQLLAEKATPGKKVILFVPQVLDIPNRWEIKLHRGLLQMTYNHKIVDVESDSRIQKLSYQHVPQMLALTKQTNPGPFFSKTIELGNYEGIFEGRQLVAMAGQRLRPREYTEISAVCTDPAFLGRGYASLLIGSQMKTILAEEKIPFLHLFPENTRALAVYEKLGFEIRKELRVYFLERVSG